MKTILLLLALNGVCFAEPLNQIKTMLDSGQKKERTEAVADLNEIIDDEKISNETRLQAIQLATKENVHECAEIIIKHIDNRWIRKKSGMSVEESFPGVEALIAFGKESLPSLFESIKREDNELRSKVLSYSLLRIMKKSPALAYLDKLIATDLSAAEKKRLEAAKEEISKWSDYELPEK
jgi:hypothetical protein